MQGPVQGLRRREFHEVDLRGQALLSQPLEVLSAIAQILFAHGVGHGELLAAALQVDEGRGFVERKVLLGRIAYLEYDEVMAPRAQALEVLEHLIDGVQQVRHEDIFRLQKPEQDRLRHTGYIPSFAEQMIENNRFDVDVFL